MAHESLHPEVVRSSSRKGPAMTMTPRVRKLALTAHVASSVGWMGAVVAFLALSIAGVTSRDADVVRSVYLAMNLVGESVVVPLGIASLLTGLIQSLGTPWGLFRYYWVTVKFALTIGATSLLLLHQFTAVAGAAKRVSATAAGTLPEVGHLGTQLVGDATLAVVVLLLNTLLSIYKPWGKTSYGRRPEESTPGTEGNVMQAPRPGRLRNVLLVLALVLGLIMLHFSCGPGHHHGM
jgi:hypothetical protein